MLVPFGARWNQISRPLGSVIIAPSWPTAIFGAVKRSPSLFTGPFFLSTLIDGGSRLGSVLKGWEGFGLAPRAGFGGGLRPGTGGLVRDVALPPPFPPAGGRPGTLC